MNPKAKLTEPVDLVQAEIAAETGSPRLNTKPLFKLMVEKKASDLFFTSYAPVKIKIEGQIYPVNKQILSPVMVKQAAYGLMNAEQIEYFEQELEIDFAISEPGLGRFRVNVFHQRGYPAIVLRYITADMPRLEQLGMPEILGELVMLKRGLILMVGAAGAGKSTTLAAMINHRNESSSDHILTIEDPIEFLHTNKKSIINQREVGLDTKSYHRALRSAMRAAPDVILIGEIRDRETTEAAIGLAGTGHLCIATLHANNAAETLDSLSRRHLVMERSGFGSRVVKYRHRLCNGDHNPLQFSPQELAIVCELLLRGPQTPGELRSRAQRLASFAGLDEVEAALEALAARADGPFVLRLARQPGAREARYAQLFTGTPEVGTEPEPSHHASRGAAAAEPGGNARLAALEAAVAALQLEIEQLKSAR